MILPLLAEPVFTETSPPTYEVTHVSGSVSSAVIFKSGQGFLPPHGSSRTVPPLSVQSVIASASSASISSHFVSTAPPKALHQHASSDAL
jgi:hypothetical protein